MDFFQSVAGRAGPHPRDVAVYGAVMAWASRRGRADRRPVLAAATSMGLGVAVAANLATAAASSIAFARARPQSPAFSRAVSGAA
jgi:hypothetical protein